MKIVSKFQDYYDAGIMYGIDENIYFKREKTELGSIYIRHYGPEQVSYTKTGIMYFCGKAYPFKVVATSKDEKPIHKDNVNTETCNYKYYWSKEEYEKDFPPKDIKEGKTWTSRFKYYNNNKPFSWGIKEVNFEEFKDRGVPYFVEGGLPNNLSDPNDPKRYTDEVYLPILKNYQFVKVLDPIKAFQEIAMFLGRLNFEEQECEIEEEYRIKGHGFNCESFRKRGKKDKDC